MIALPRLEPRPIEGLPVKQAGLAAQQADAAAERIAFEAGAGNTPRPYRPVLRALLLTGEAALYLRSGAGGPPQVSRSTLWWPATKVVGRYLTGYLAAA